MVRHSSDFYKLTIISMKKTTSEAKHELVGAVEDAKKAIASAAAEALKVSNVSKNEDHDLLIRIATQVEQVIRDVAEIKTNTVGRIDKIEVDYVTKAEHEKVTIRLDKMENWKNWVLGLGASIAVITALIIYIWTTQMTRIEKSINQVSTQLTEHIETK